MKFEKKEREPCLLGLGKFRSCGLGVKRYDPMKGIFFCCVLPSMLSINTSNCIVQGTLRERNIEMCLSSSFIADKKWFVYYMFFTRLEEQDFQFAITWCHRTTTPTAAYLRRSRGVHLEYIIISPTRTLLASILYYRHSAVSWSGGMTGRSEEDDSRGEGRGEKM